MGQALILFTQFFTRISIPIAIPDATNKFKQNIQYLTFFGLLVGCVEAVIFWGFTLIFPLWFAWILYWITDGLMTGGFHLDALADTADGLYSSRAPEKMHAIMKDSRLGTMGSLGLLYFYLIVISCGIIIAPQLPLWQLVGLTAITTMMAKTGITVLFYKMVYSGSGPGLSSVWVGVTTWRIVTAQLFSVIVIGAVLRWPGLIAYLVVLVLAYFYRRFHIHLLHGFTGDTIGAYGDLSQVIFLLVYTGLAGVML